MPSKRRYDGLGRVPEQTAPSTPPAGFVEVYALPNGRLCIKADDALEVPLGGPARLFVQDTEPTVGYADGDLWYDSDAIPDSLGYQNHGNAGSTETIDPGVAVAHRLVLDSATCTLTISSVASGDYVRLVLYIVQDATGGRLITWPGSVKWHLGQAAVLSTAQNAVDRIILDTVDGGTTWHAFFTGKGMA